MNVLIRKIGHILKYNINYKQVGHTLLFIFLFLIYKKLIIHKYI